MEFLKVREDESVRIPAEPLLEFTATLFQRLGVPKADSETAAHVLVLADLRGIDSHGVQHYIESIYVPGLTQGRINPRPQIRVVRETPVSALVNGDGGLGLVVGPFAMRLAIQKALAAGVGMVAVQNSRHYGAAQIHALMALEHDLIGLSMTNASPIVVPTFGREPRLGTNPLSIAVPAGKEPPFVLDIATSTVAMGKVVIAEALGRSIPLGWATDENGIPTTDPQKARAARRLTPLGGTPEHGSHKGYGLGAMVDILTGVLSGAGHSVALHPQGAAGHFFAAWRIDLFRPVAEFKRDMDTFLRTLRETPPAPGYSRVLYPGLPEWETEQERRAKGIPIPRKTLAYFRRISAELGIPYTFKG
ncbi:MAG: Ldh family oxidoreductase [Dehalococcoidia bacterium]|nr:Ldh family oxidoreductase [Dehalococcoidia bacterium]MDW8119080.1 Ldh family oxidoreductase [Chloroflexota bacterium]